MSDRSVWGSKIGFLLAAIGSAVGLGNIWRFGYMAYANGGGAFLIPYAIALLTAGIPLLIAEFSLGFRERAASALAFARIHPLWEPFGWWMPMIAFLGIALFYSVVIGWCLNYFCFAFNQSWGTDTETFFFKKFLHITESPYHLGTLRWPIFAGALLTWGIVWAICYREVSHGIEKASMIFMPLLFVLTLVLVVWSLQLDGAVDAIKNHYLKCDFAKINPLTKEGLRVWVAAYGQIFFTLSLGFGIMITYASYLPKGTKLVGNAVLTACLNCLFSFITGFAVFGTIGHMALAKGVPFDQAITAGPGLAFVVYPEAINQLPVGKTLFGIIFFLVLIVAGISSLISLTESFSCAIHDKFKVSRKKTATIACIIGAVGSTIFATQGGLYILDIVDHFINNYALILGGIVECVLIGWLLKARVMRAFICKQTGSYLPIMWDIAIRFVTPIILTAVLGSALVHDFSKAYEGYPVPLLLGYGGGVLVFTWIISFIMSHIPWDPKKLTEEHHPEDENLLT